VKLRSVLLMLLISVGLFSLALLFAYLFWWTEYYDEDSLKSGFIFLSVGGSALVLHILISLLIFLPRRANVDATIFFERGLFFSMLSPKKVKLFKIVTPVLSFPIAILLFMLFFFLINSYEYEHLKTYGERSKVLIQAVRKTKKELPFALVEFDSKGRSCSKELLSEKYHKGDTVEIIFSTKRPEIVMWYEEFKRK